MIFHAIHTYDCKSCPINEKISNGVYLPNKSIKENKKSNQDR